MKRILVLVLAFLLLPSLSIADPQMDREPGVQPSAVRGIQGAAGMIPLETTPAVGAGGATEAKQDALNALIVIIDAVLDAIKLDTANISSDQATETTSAAILAKILAAPSTEAKQDDLNALVVIIDAVLDAIKLDTANISSDQATETTSAAILAKILAAPATEAKQDTGNTSLASILAKIIAAPATEAKQDTGNTNTTAIELNTDTATTFADGTVSVTTTATSISAASATRRSILIRNADSNTVLFVGPTSGVTTANGLPVGTAGASGATGNGGTVIYTHTGAIWGIVASGTADVRFQTESD